MAEIFRLRLGLESPVRARTTSFAAPRTRCIEASRNTTANARLLAAGIHVVHEQLFRRAKSRCVEEHGLRARGPPKWPRGAPPKVVPGGSIAPLEARPRDESGGVPLLALSRRLRA